METQVDTLLQSQEGFKFPMRSISEADTCRQFIGLRSIHISFIYHELYDIDFAFATLDTVFSHAAAMIAKSTQDYANSYQNKSTYHKEYISKGDADQAHRFLPQSEERTRHVNRYLPFRLSYRLLSELMLQVGQKFFFYAHIGGHTSRVCGSCVALLTPVHVEREKVVEQCIQEFFCSPALFLAHTHSMWITFRNLRG